MLRVALLSDAGVDLETGNRFFHVLPQVRAHRVAWAALGTRYHGLSSALMGRITSDRIDGPNCDRAHTHPTHTHQPTADRRPPVHGRWIAGLYRLPSELMALITSDCIEWP